MGAGGRKFRMTARCRPAAAIALMHTLKKFPTANFFSGRKWRKLLISRHFLFEAENLEFSAGLNHALGATLEATEFA